MKTLEEREAAYAEARRRILGSAPESECQTMPTKTRSNKSVSLEHHFFTNVCAVGQRMSSVERQFTAVNCLANYLLLMTF